jgi:hypothetical protein
MKNKQKPTQPMSAGTGRENDRTTTNKQTNKQTNEAPPTMIMRVPSDLSSTQLKTTPLVVRWWVTTQKRQTSGSPGLATHGGRKYVKNAIHMKNK